MNPGAMKVLGLLGGMSGESTDYYYQRRGAEAVIFGCTEIGLLLGERDSPPPVYDTTLLHVKAALDWSLAQGSPRGGVEAER